MLIDRATAEGIAEGRVTLAFRRWDTPRMRPGSTQRTVAGVLEVVRVEEVDPAAITEDDARLAGVASLDRLHRLLDRRPGARVFRMEVRPAGPDPRVALREQSELSDADRRTLDERLDRWDAARAAPVDPRGAAADRRAARPSGRPTSPPRWAGRPSRSSATSGSSRSWA